MGLHRAGLGGRSIEAVRATRPGLRLAAFVAASGSAGTLAAGDYLKEQHGARIVAVEASECPTLLRNGFGEHNIQGIGDKHVPLIHNVMNTDIVVGVSERSTGALDLLFNSRDRPRLSDGPAADRSGGDRRARAVGAVGDRQSGRGDQDGQAARARRRTTSSSPSPPTPPRSTPASAGNSAPRTTPTGFDAVNAGEAFGQHLCGIADNDVLELTHHERSRIFNLGYYTWVEQQGVPLAAFERRRSQDFWAGLRRSVPAWDALIAEFNAAAGFGDRC